MSDEREPIVRRYFEELDRLGAVPDDLCTADYTLRAAGSPPMDLQAVQQYTVAFFTGMPDLQHPLDELSRRATRSPAAADTRAHTPEN
jgi:hypothetical protein